MKQVRQIMAVMVLISFFTAASLSCAAENTLREVFQDALYGAGIGAIIGAAFMAFTKEPFDHRDNIGYGAAVGALAGTSFGLAKSARALAEIDNGKIKIAVPTIVPDLVVSPRQNTVMWSASILRGTFN